MVTNLDDQVRAYQGDNIYDFDNTILLNAYPKRIAKYTRGAKSLLELGLGHGITASVFEKHFDRHVVVDASAAVIDNFRARYPHSKITIVQSYFETFQTDERFDVVMFGNILEHVEDPVAVLEHFRQFRAPGGKMFVTVPNAEALNRRLGHIAGLLKDMQELSDNDRLLGHRRYYTEASLRDDIGAAGYVVKRMEGVYLKPLTTSQMLSLKLPEAVIDAFCEVAVDYPELSCVLLAEIAVKGE